MHRGALFVILSLLLQCVSTQVTVTSFNAPANNLGVGVFDSEQSVSYFLSNSNPATVSSVAFSAAGPVSTLLAGSVSIGGPTSVGYFSLSRDLFVGGNGGISRYNVLKMQETGKLSLPTIGKLVLRQSEDNVSDQLLFASDVPKAGTATTIYYIDARTLAVIDSLTLPLADGSVTALLFDSKRNNLILGTTAAPNGRIVRLSTVGRRLTRVDHHELPINLNGVSAGFLDSTRDAAFFSISNPRSFIIKLDLASFTRTHVFDAPATPKFRFALNDAVRGYSYWFTDGTNAPALYRFESCNFKLVDTTPLAVQPVGAALGSEIFLSTNSQSLLRLNVAGGVTCTPKDAFRRITSRKDSCLVDVRAGVTDPVNNMAYFVTNTPHANVLSVDLSSSSLNVTKIFKLSAGNARSVAIDVQRKRLFVGLNDNTAGQLTKLDISTTDPHVIGSKALAHGARSIVYDAVENVVYACTNPRGFGRGNGVVHKINADSLDIIETLNLLPGDDGCNVILHDSMRGALYVGTGSYPTRIIKLTTRPFARESFIELNSQFNQTSTGFIDSSMKFAYFGTWMPQGAVIKVNIETFTFVDIFSPVGTPAFTASLDDPTHGVSYWITNELPATIHRLRMCDFSYVDSFKLRRNEEVPYAATLSARGGLVLATGMKIPGLEASSGVCGSLVQLQPGKCVDCPAVPSTLTRVATSLQPPTTAKDARAGVVDYHTGTGYFITYTIPALVLKVELGTLALSQKLVLTNNLGRSAAIDGNKRKAYFGMGTTPGSIVKVDLATFTVESTIATPFAVTALTFDEVEGVLYAATSAPAGQASVVHKINGLTLEVVSTVPLEARDGQSRTIQLDRKRGFLYIGTGSSPARIVRLKTSRFERINYIEFPFGYNEIGTSLANNDQAIFSISKPFARLVTVGFDGFKWQETLNFPGVSAFTSAVTDPINGYSYWFTDSVPSAAHRVRMCNFEKADVFPLREADEVPRSAVYGVGKITVATSCALNDLDNTCGLDHRLSFVQLQGGGAAQCTYANPAPAVTQNVINSTLVSLRFNFKGMIPPIKYQN